MKKLKKQIFSIFLTFAMVFSGCLASDTVSANETIDNATNNGMYIEKNYIEDLDNINDDVAPNYSPNLDVVTGSDLAGNEGQIWTHKKVDYGDSAGEFRITLQARGFKYRNVGVDNLKEPNNWKNPLARDSELTIKENIPENYQLKNENITVIKKDGLNFDTPFLIEDNSVSLVFNSDNVDIVSSEGGIAFDVEISFIVELTGKVVANTEYKTGMAESTFKPALDNYYYKWGWQKTDSFKTGLKWKTPDSDFSGRIQRIY